MRKYGILVLCLLFVSSAALAQHEAAKKPLSPPAKATGTIGGQSITVEYSAPSKRGREIMGGLVPWGKVWRTGANAATTLTTSGDLMIGSLHVPAGKYTLFTVPGEKEWTLIVNKQTGQWGTNYDQSQDLGRVSMTVKPVQDTVETFAVAVTPTQGKNGTISFTWENTQAVAGVMAH